MYNINILYASIVSDDIVNHLKINYSLNSAALHATCMYSPNANTNTNYSLFIFSAIIAGTLSNITSGSSLTQGSNYCAVTLSSNHHLLGSSSVKYM